LVEILLFKLFLHLGLSFPLERILLRFPLSTSSSPALDPSLESFFPPSLSWKEKLLRRKMSIRVINLFSLCLRDPFPFSAAVNDLQPYALGETGVQRVCV